MEVIIGDVVYQETIEVPIQRGIDGEPGPTLELRVFEGYIQWRPVGSTEWTNLVAILEITPTIKFTEEGGLAIRMTNGTGVSSIKGSLVSASPTSDNQFVLQSNEFDTVGIVYESGIANGQPCWVVVSGLADVLLQNGSGATRGNVAIAAPTDGRMITIAVPSSNPTIGEHFKEIGHCMETKVSGIDVLVRCILHFN